MDKIRDFPDGPRTAMILALFPLACCLMQGFVPERSFTKDRRVIDMRIDSVLTVCSSPDPCYRQITDFIE